MRGRGGGQCWRAEALVTPLGASEIAGQNEALWDSIVRGGGDVATTLAFLFWVRVGETMDSNQTWSISGVSGTERLRDPCSLLPDPIPRRVRHPLACSSPSSPNQSTSDEYREKTMKTGCWLFVAISLFTFSHLARAEDLIVGNKVYKDYQVVRTQPDAIIIKHSAGIATLYFWELPVDLQKKYNYDPEKVTEVQPADPVPQALPTTPVPPPPPSGDGLQDTPLTDQTPGSPSLAASPDSGFKTWDDPTYGSFNTDYPPGWVPPPGWTRERWERERRWLREERRRQEQEKERREAQREKKDPVPTPRAVAQPATRQTPATVQPAVHQASQPVSKPQASQPPAQQSKPSPPAPKPPPPPPPKQQPPPSQNNKTGQ
jgi:hypothetical protein